MLLRASTPGRTLPENTETWRHQHRASNPAGLLCPTGHSPSSSSRLAPPPVLTWLTLSSVFHFAQQVAVSPPPGRQHIRSALKGQISNLLSVRSQKVSLTDDSNATVFGHLHHVVHQTLCPFGEVVPLKHPDRAVPHNLLGPGHGLGIGLGALWSAVQTLKEQIRMVRACRDGSSVPGWTTISPSSRRGCLRRRSQCQ